MKTLYFAVLLFLVCAFGVEAQRSVVPPAKGGITPAVCFNPINLEEVKQGEFASFYILTYELSPCDNSELRSLSLEERNDPGLSKNSIFVRLPNFLEIKNGLPYLDRTIIGTDTLVFGGGMSNFGGNVVVVWPHGAHVYFKQPFNIAPVKRNINQNMSTIYDIPEHYAHPNPTPKLIKVATPGSKGDASIFDTRGKKVKTMKIDDNGNIDLEGLEPGIYYIVVQLTDGRIITLKVVKE